MVKTKYTYISGWKRAEITPILANAGKFFVPRIEGYLNVVAIFQNVCLFVQRILTELTKKVRAD